MGTDRSKHNGSIVGDELVARARQGELHGQTHSEGDEGGTEQNPGHDANGKAMAHG